MVSKRQTIPIEEATNILNKAGVPDRIIFESKLGTVNDVCLIYG